MSSIIPSRPERKGPVKPGAEIVVEGELSPFEHEALYQLLRKHFSTRQPVFKELDDDTVGTMVNITFSHSYDRSFFMDIFPNGWRPLKDLFKQITYRRGRLGAAFNLSFSDQKYSLTFSTGVLDDQALGSAMDQLAHLTGVIGQMLRPETMTGPLAKIEVAFDGKSDRWSELRGFDPSGKEYSFHEASFRWESAVHPE